jgi:hypothetical protein
MNKDSKQVRAHTTILGQVLPFINLTISPDTGLLVNTLSHRLLYRVSGNASVYPDFSLALQVLTSHPETSTSGA